MDRTPLLSEPLPQQGLYYAPPAPPDPALTASTARSPSTRRNLEVDIVSGAHVSISIEINKRPVGGTSHFKTVINAGATVLEIANALRGDLLVDQFAARQARGMAHDLRYLYSCVQQDGAVVLGKENGGLLFPDKNAVITSFGVTYSYEGVPIKKQEDCCCAVA